MIFFHTTTKIFKVDRGIIGLYKREYKEVNKIVSFSSILIKHLGISFMDQLWIYDAEGYIFWFSAVYDRRLWLLDDAKGRFVADNTMSCVGI